MVTAREDQPGRVSGGLCGEPGATRPNGGGTASVLGREVAGIYGAGVFVPLLALPLNANGKVDRRALPAPDQNLRTGKEYVRRAPAIERQRRNLAGGAGSRKSASTTTSSTSAAIPCWLFALGGDQQSNVSGPRRSNSFEHSTGQYIGPMFAAEQSTRTTRRVSVAVWDSWPAGVLFSIEAVWDYSSWLGD